MDTTQINAIAATQGPILRWHVEDDQYVILFVDGRKIRVPIQTVERPRDQKPGKQKPPKETPLDTA